MTFKEIMEIDQEPFDDDMIERLCDYRKNLPYLMENIMTYLVERYFKIFADQYRLNLAVSEGHFIMTGQAAEDAEDYEFEYLSAGYYLCASAFESLGWSFLTVDLENDEFQSSDDESVEREWASEQIRYWVEHNAEAGEMDLEMMLRERDIWLDTVKYMEYGSLFFFWNDKLSNYLKIRKDDPDLIEQTCKNENAEIDKLLKNIWFPTVYFDNCSEGGVCGRSYGLISLGCNGEIEVGFDSFNPNWITRAFVLERLLSLALSKIQSSFVKKAA